jgi:hypothetical protein
MLAGRSFIATMDIRLSLLVSLLLSLAPQPLLAPQPPTTSSTSMPPPLEAIYASKEELYIVIQVFAA